MLLYLKMSILVFFGQPPANLFRWLFSLPLDFCLLYLLRWVILLICSYIQLLTILPWAFRLLKIVWIRQLFLNLFHWLLFLLAFGDEDFEKEFNLMMVDSMDSMDVEPYSVHDLVSLSYFFDIYHLVSCFRLYLIFLESWSFLVGIWMVVVLIKNGCMCWISKTLAWCDFPNWNYGWHKNCE